MELRENMQSLLSIWVKPRETVRKLIEQERTKFVILLAILGGIASTLDRASGKSMGETLTIPTILLIGIVGGAIGGIVTLIIGTALIEWTGRWIGGQASFNEIKTALAWSNVTAIVSLLLWIPLGLLYGKEMFTEEMPTIASNPTLASLFFVFMALDIILFIWTYVILVKGVAEAQRFSAWKGLLNLVLSALVIIIPLALIGVLIFFTS